MRWRDYPGYSQWALNAKEGNYHIEEEMALWDGGRDWSVMAARAEEVPAETSLAPAEGE